MAADFGDKFIEFNRIKYDLFKTQDPENGRFDVIFEVEGKLLFAHRNMLTLVSDTFNSWLSDRWSPNKDDPVKIADYRYDDFYQFITFLYSAKCELSVENISSMVDIAEFYGVALFKEFCDEYLAARKITTENIFQFMDLAEKYSMAQLKSSAYRFISLNIQRFAECDGFLKADKQVIQEIIIGVKDKIKHEDLFLAIYKWTEKHAMDKLAANPNLNLNDTIKAEFSDFLLLINFREMDLQFLHKFVVPKSFIFPTLDEFSEILCDRYPGTKVEVINTRVQELHGKILPDKNMINLIQSANSKSFLYTFGDNYCWWSTDHKLSSTPNSLKKRNGIEWYLVYSRYGDIGVQHCSVLHEDNYILAEMIPGDSGFQLTQDCEIQME